MKRPLMGILAGLVLGELCACLLGPIGLIMPASLFLWSFQNRKLWKEQKPFFLLIFWLSFSVIVGFFIFTMEEGKIRKTEKIAKNLEGEGCSIEGTIEKEKISSSGWVTLTITRPRITQGKRAMRIHGKMTITGKAEEERCLPGDDIVAQGKVQLLEKASNPGGFDERSYSLSSGVYISGFFESIETIHRPPISFQRWADQVKRKMEEGYLTHLSPEDSAMLCAMIFGEKSYLSEEQKRLYEENGVAHLLAISGLHVSIVGGLIYRRLRKKGFSYGSSCILGAVFLFFYGCMTGFGASASRAITMYLIFLLGEYLGLSYDLISSLALTGILMLMAHPYRLFDGGFLISFASIFAIGSVVPFVFEHMECGKNKIKDAIMFSLIIYMVTCPIILYFYYEVTPYSVLWNLFLIPAMLPLMLDGIFAGVMGLLVGHYRILSIIAIGILRAHNIFLKTVRMLPASLLLPGHPPIWRIFAYYGAGLFLCFFLWKNHKKSSFVVWLAMICLILCPGKRPDMRITMLDVGQGDCILLESNGKTLLLDGGSSTKKEIYHNVIEPALRYYGIASLDAVLVTHMDEDHLSGIRELIQAGFPVKELFLSDTKENRQEDEVSIELQKCAKKQKAKVVFLKKGDHFTFGKMELSCLHPGDLQSFEEKNDSSLVLLAEYGSFRGLFTGDLGENQEEKLIASRNHFPITILKVGHHGSKYSTGEAFLSYFQPKIALISAGKGNRYGHPHNDVLNRLHKAGSRIFDTISAGAIIIEGEKELRIQQWKTRSILTYPTF